MADLLPRCRRPTWGAVSTPPRPFRDLPAALLHLRDHSFKGHHTIPAIHPTPDNQGTGRPGTRAAAHTTPGMAWDIGDPISMGPTRGGSPSATVFPPFGDDQDEGSAQVAPPQPDDSNQPPADYGPEVAANSSVTLPAHLPGANRSRPGAWAARHHFDLQGWTAAGAGA